MPKEFKFVTQTQVPTWDPMIIVSKRNTVEKGYYQDEFMKYVCPKTSQDPFVSLYFYMRVPGLRKRIECFYSLFKDQKVQFVNLGCGTDTMGYWVLQNFPNAVCFEIDLEFEVKVKRKNIESCPELLKLFPNYKTTDVSFHSDRYHLFVLDLLETKNLEKLKEHGFSDELPTVFLNEFTMVFINDVPYDNNIKYCSTLTKAPAMFVTAEYTKPNTTFGKWYNAIYDDVIPVPSLLKYPDFPEQVKRYKDLGWDEAYFNDFNYNFTHLTDRKERDRVRNLENYKHWDVLGVYTSISCIGVALKNLPKGVDFVKLLEREPAGPDEVVPVSYTAEQLDEVDVEPAVQSVIDFLKAVFENPSEEFKKYCDKYK